MIAINKVCFNKIVTNPTMAPPNMSKQRNKKNGAMASKIGKVESDAHVRRPWTPSACLRKCISCRTDKSQKLHFRSVKTGYICLSCDGLMQFSVESHLTQPSDIDWTYMAWNKSVLLIRYMTPQEKLNKSGTRMKNFFCVYDKAM
jgi:hypothetical protein